MKALRVLTLPTLLQAALERSPNRPALVSEGLCLTYAQALEAARALASRLQAAGLSRGDRVLLLVDGGPVYIVGVFGILLAGGWVVPVNPEDPPSRLRWVAEEAQCDWLVTDCQEVDMGLEPEKSLVPVDGDLRALASVLREHPIDPDAEALILYTSGTVGRAKGVVLSHRNLLQNAADVVEYLQLSSTDVVLIFLPLAYSYALSQLLTALLVSARVVFLPNMLHPAYLVRVVQEHQVTGFGGVATSFNLLCEYLERQGEQLPSLRFVMNAGGPIPVPTLERLLRLLPHVEIFNCYGCTEIGPRATYLPSTELQRRPGSIGKALPSVKLRVVGEDGSDIAPGEIGEIVLQGPTLMKGYYRDPEATARAVRADGFHTGDLATVDVDGFLYFRGRLDDVFKIGGEKVSPLEIEEVLIRHPDVLEAGVIGIPHELLGSVPKAIVVARPGRTINEVILRRWCSETLPRHCVPRVIEVRDSLEKTPRGKIARARMREQHGRN